MVNLLLNDLIEDLPLPQRLALTYVPIDVRRPTLALLALDARLARILSQSREPILVQMRLAWWRDELDKPVQDRPNGDPLLDLIGQAWAGHESGLTELVNGWEELLAEAPFPEQAAAKFVTGRAEAFATLADILGHVSAQDDAFAAARYWAVVDLLARLSDETEQETARALLDTFAEPTAVLPKDLRPLTVLSGLAMRAVKKREREIVGSRMSTLAAMRLGMFGR